VIVLTPLNLPHSLDEQTFIRTLTTLCLTQAMQILILDPTNSDTVQQKFGKSLKLSSPSVIASRIAAKLVHMVLEGGKVNTDRVPWCDSDVSPWRLPPDVFELTPRDVWGFLKTHPNFNDVDLKTFYQTLVEKAYCSGFGPVIRQPDLENALLKVCLSG